MPEILTTKELSKYLKLHEITVLKWANKGQIPGWRIGHSWRFEKDVIDKLFQSKRWGKIVNQRGE